MFHAVSEDFKTVINSNKYAHDQFIAARSSVIGAMLTHEPDTIREAEQAVTEVMQRFEDTSTGGYFSAADQQWQIVDSTKNLITAGELFGVLMHLYEVSKNDNYLLKALDFLDITLTQAWDAPAGGFFSLYDREWKAASQIKDLATQAGMLQHLNGSWKDGMDSPYGARSAIHRERAELFADLLLERCKDRNNGGFFTHFTADWTPITREKDVNSLALFALALFFHYHTIGPSIWGPRKGSHAYTGRPYPATYSYRGPAPQNEPVSEKAYRFGKTVIAIADLLITNAWDGRYGGFYTSLTERYEPHECTKQLQTQMSCLMALNVAYRLTGFKRFHQKISEAVEVIEQHCFDPEHGGVYALFDRDWIPRCREKECGLNLMSMGILTMMNPVVHDCQVTRQSLMLWIEPSHITLRDGEGQCTITVQNQGFELQRVRIGGLTSPSRWMHPAEVFVDLAPHEVKSFSITIQPPHAMPAGRYGFEITCMPEGELMDYVGASGVVIIE